VRASVNDAVSKLNNPELASYNETNPAVRAR